MHYPADKNTWRLDDQCLLGQGLLLAPVTAPGKDKRLVYLPEGVWYDWWTKERYCGRQHVIADAPLHKMPLFVKAGTIMPMSPVVNYQGERPEDTLTLDIFVDEKGTSVGQLYCDDGISFDYARGKYKLWHFVLDREIGQVRFSVTESGLGQSPYLNIALNFIGLLKPALVTTLAGETLPWEYSDGILTIAILKLTDIVVVLPSPPPKICKEEGNVMVDLKGKAFLDVKLVLGQLQFGDTLTQVAPARRSLDEARYAFLDQGAGGLADLYYMYRDVAREEDRGVLLDYGLRFDITVIMPGLIGTEYIKTVGHYHPVKVGTDYTYPEVYEVLAGEATYLLQRPGENPGTVADAIIVVARPGQKVVIPPGYGHITINGGREPLVMANWVAAEFSSVYGEIKELRGGAYYLVEEGGTPRWIVNPRYAEVPELKFASPQEYPQFGLYNEVPMYTLINGTPERLRFLTHPEEFLWSN
ncbi:MAG: Alpha-xylosidase BoGH31A [Firmicutes bacterium]|nr:Alpha-xylosidase BoGH31A [Bacillota bacterium]